MSIKKLAVAMVFLAAGMMGVGAEEEEEGEALYLCNMSQEEVAACLPAMSNSSGQAEEPGIFCCQELWMASDIPCFCDIDTWKPLLLPDQIVDADIARTVPEKCGLQPCPD